MSLFEDSSYQYRETYFVFFDSKNSPTADELTAMIKDLGPRYKVLKTHAENSVFEAMTIVSEQDNAGIDIAVVEGEEVTEKIAELNEAFKTTTVAGDDIAKLKAIGACDSCFDIYHFERISTVEDEMLDPGALLIVMDGIKTVTQGIGYDPQSTAIM